MEKHYTNLGNFYGVVALNDKGEGVYSVELDDHSSTLDIPISKELFDLMKKELIF